MMGSCVNCRWCDKYEGSLKLSPEEWKCNFHAVTIEEPKNGVTGVVSSVTYGVVRCALLNPVGGCRGHANTAEDPAKTSKTASKIGA